MAILGKLGSALNGFWWALDEHERQQLLVAGCWLLGLLVTELGRREREAALEEQRQALACELVDELERRGRLR